MTPKSGLVHCESHSLKMFITFLNRRHDGSTRKDSFLHSLYRTECIYGALDPNQSRLIPSEDNRLRALFEELAKHWPPKPRSKKCLVSDEDEPEAEEDDVEAGVWVWFVG